MNNKYYPLTPIQRDIWLGEQIKNRKEQFTISGFVKIESLISEKKLYNAIECFINNTDVFGIKFREKNSIVEQCFNHDNNRVNIDIMTISVVSEMAAIRLMDNEAKIHLNFEKNQLHSFKIITSPKSIFVFFKFHHIIADSYSITAFFNKINQYYFGLSQLKIANQIDHLMYEDFLIDRQKYIDDPICQKDEQYWMNYFSRAIRPADAFSNLFAPARSPLRKMHHLKFELNSDLYLSLKSFLEIDQISLLNFFLAILYAHFYSIYAEKSIFILLPIHNRLSSDSKDIFGLMMDFLPIHISANYDTPISDVMQTIRKDVKECLEHSFFPAYDKLKELIRLQKMNADTYDIRVSYTDNSIDNTITGKSDIMFFPNKMGDVDFSFHIRKYTNKLRVELDYDLNTINSTEASFLINSLQFFLSHPTITKEMSVKDLFIVPDTDKKIIYGAPVLTHKNDETLLDFFYRSVASHPQAIACDDGQRQLTYRELDNESEQIAMLLQKYGQTKGSKILCCFDRTASIISTLIAIFKIGGIYVPIIPSQPLFRIKYYAENSGAKLAVTDKINEHLFQQLNLNVLCLEDEPRISKKNGIRNYCLLPDDHAYIIYTSGSTGLPKGVVITHRSLLNVLVEVKKSIGFSTGNSFGAVSSFSFDMSCLELLLPLISGGKIALLDFGKSNDPFRLIRQLRVYKPHYFQATPSTYQLLIESGWTNEENMKLITSGESISDTLKNRLLSLPTPTLWNLYGPTETTIFSTLKRLSKNEKVNIGKPLNGNSIIIMNGNRNILPIGFVGEIFIGGVQLTPGYLNSEVQNNEAFIEKDINGKSVRLYKTGDFGRWNENGDIEYLGRRDEQIKLRGYRIEIGEIESVLNSFVDLRNGLIVVTDSEVAGKELVAFVVPKNELFDKKSLLSFLNSNLPHHMVPTEIVVCDTIPVNNNGKIDKRKLLQLRNKKNLSNEKPKDTVEFFLLHLFRELLNKDNIGLKDSFLQIGGHSLSIVSLMSRIYKKYGIRIEFNQVYEHNSIKELSEIIRIKIFESKSLVTKKIAYSKDTISSIFDKKMVRNFLCFSKFNGIELGKSQNNLVLTGGSILNNKKFVSFIKKNSCEIIKQLEKNISINIIRKELLYESSYLQNSVWRFLQLKGHFSNIGFGLKVHGTIDKYVLQKSFIKVLERHESLRTKFFLDDETLFQRILPINEFYGKIKHFKVTKENDVEKIIGETKTRIFDFFNEDPLIEMNCIEFGKRIHYLWINVSHIIFDGASINVFWSDLFQNYFEDIGNNLPSFQFKDYIGYLRFAKLMDLHMYEKRYWSKLFKKTYRFTPLSIQKESSSSDNNVLNTSLLKIEIDSTVSRRIKDLCNTQKCTLSNFFLTLYINFITDYSHANDILLSTNVSNRESGLFEDQIGLYTNSLFFRYNFESQVNFFQLLKDVSMKYLVALNHSKYLSSNEIFDELKLDRYGHELLRKYTYNFITIDEIDFSKGRLRIEKHSKKYEKFGCYYLLFFVQQETDSIKIFIEGNLRYFSSDQLTYVKNYINDKIVYLLQKN